MIICQNANVHICPKAAVGLGATGVETFSSYFAFLPTVVTKGRRLVISSKSKRKELQLRFGHFE
jgi:hypothetical protein